MQFGLQLNALAEAVQDMIGDRFSLWIYGSLTLEDYRHGWSDIDMLCLTEYPLSAAQADALLMLRQRLCGIYSDDAYRLFEGIFVDRKSFLEHSPSTVVYWGTSGQRILDSYTLDSFARYELINSGWLIYGQDMLCDMPSPGYAELCADVRRHYEAIRRYAAVTDGSLYSCGWLLDIARCLYTLRTGQVISKTDAGEWAMANGLCNVPEALSRTLEVRRDPLAYKSTTAYISWARGLGATVQHYADMLQSGLEIADRRENIYNV